MFKYTRAVIHDIVFDLKNFRFIFNLITQIAYIIYLAYAIFASLSNIYVNSILLALSIAYFILFLILHNKKSAKANDTKLIARRTYKWSKLLINAFTLGISVYSIYVTSSNANPISIALTAIMLIFWIISVILEIVIYFIDCKKELLIAGFQRDIEFITKPLNTAEDLINKVTRHEPKEHPKLSNRVKSTLDKVLKEHKEYKANKK